MMLTLFHPLMTLLDGYEYFISVGDTVLKNDDVTVCPVCTTCMQNTVDVIRPVFQDHLRQCMQQWVIMESILKDSFACTEQLDVV